MNEMLQAAYNSGFVNGLLWAAGIVFIIATGLYVIGKLHD